MRKGSASAEVLLDKPLRAIHLILNDHTNIDTTGMCY